MTLDNLTALTGQSPGIPQNIPNGGSVAVVPNAGYWENFPKAEYGQTVGMKYCGPTSTMWPWFNFDDPTRGRVRGMDGTYLQYYYNANPTHKQVLVRHAAGGQPIHEWTGQNHMIMNLRNSWDACMRSPEIAALGGPRRADNFIMAQCEADYLLAGHIWADEVLKVIHSLRKAHGPWDYPIIGPDTKIVFCESPALAPLNARNGDMWRLEERGIRIIKADGIVPFDGIHADALGLQAMGARIYNALHVTPAS